MNAHEDNLQHTHDLIDHVAAVSEFGNAVLDSAVNPSVSHVLKNGHSVVTNTAICVRDYIKGDSAGISMKYTDKGILQSNGAEPSKERNVRTSIDVGKTNYKAELSTEPGDKIRSEANLEREGYGKHRFTRKNRQQAASLITALAVKRVAKDATGAVDSINEKREAYLKKTKK